MARAFVGSPAAGIAAEHTAVERENHFPRSVGLSPDYDSPYRQPFPLRAFREHRRTFERVTGCPLGIVFREECAVASVRRHIVKSSDWRRTGRRLARLLGRRKCARGWRTKNRRERLIQVLLHG